MGSKLYPFRVESFKEGVQSKSPPLKVFQFPLNEPHEKILLIAYRNNERPDCRSACIFTYFDQGLLCSLTESSDPVELIDDQVMTSRKHAYIVLTLYTVKLGFTRYTLFFLFLLKTLDCGYSLESPRGGSNEYSQSMFEQKDEKYQFLIWKFSFFGGKIFSIFE